MKRLKIFTDARIIRRIRENDRTVLGELYVANERMVLTYIIRNGGNRDDAEDMLQEAIIVLWQKACSDDFSLQSKASTFLYAIVKNKWMAELRKRKRIQGEPDENTVQNDPNVLDRIVAEEKMEAVEKAMDKISLICRKILILFYFEERNMADIARLLKFANADVVKAKKYQCKKALEEAMNFAGA